MKKLKKLKKLFIVLLLFLNCATLRDWSIGGLDFGELWTKGEIPYYFLYGFTKEQEQIVHQCAGDWSRAGVKFIYTPFGSKEYYKYSYHVIISPIFSGSCSTVGMRDENYVQLSIYQNNFNKMKGTIRHEFGHILGLVHEHQRPDRNEYVTIYWKNIIEEERINFKILDNPLLNEEKFPYDFKSIMHYSWTAASSNGKVTMLKKDGHCVHNFSEISEIDIKKIKDMYK
jgi:hypothetical protein